MVYFDNAATTFPKPTTVINKMTEAIKFCGNPGRGGHFISMKTAEKVYNVRESCASFFKADAENIVITPGCTYSLNFAIKGIMTPNSHIITSSLEHNAVIRPIYSLINNNCTYSVAKVEEDDDQTVCNFEKLITPDTKAIACTIASNVTGQILPYKRIAALCEKYGLCFIADGAQACGVLPVCMTDGINILCVPGHKGLYGPMGVGLMITDGKFPLNTVIEGGTGSASSSLVQPEFLPDRMESGTINTLGAIALGAGIDFVRIKGIKNIYAHEKALCDLFVQLISEIKGVIRYQGAYPKNSVPVVSFGIKKYTSEQAAAILSDSGFCLRGGLHCAFMAHNSIGTLKTGAVRFAPSVFNTADEVKALSYAIKHMTAQKPSDITC